MWRHTFNLCLQDVVSLNNSSLTVGCNFHQPHFPNLPKAMVSQFNSYGLTVYVTCFNFRPTMIYQSIKIWNHHANQNFWSLGTAVIREKWPRKRWTALLDEYLNHKTIHMFSIKWSTKHGTNHSMLIQLHGTSAATLELNSERVYILISSSENYNM